VITGEAYTHSTWRVKPGLEDEFVRRWEDLAHWSALQGLTSRAKLLRDTDEPSRFVSFGPWESMDSVRRWRAAPGSPACKSSLTTSSRGRLRSCPSAEKAGGTLASVTVPTRATIRPDFYLVNPAASSCS
jgi:heme-degrading monooxygenase HmoA